MDFKELRVATALGANLASDGRDSIAFCERQHGQVS